MKRILPLLFVLAISNASFSQSAIQPKFNLEKGKVYKLKNTSNQNVISSFNGNSFTTTVTSGNSISLKLLAQEGDMMQIEMKIDTIQTKSVSPMGNRETNSAILAKKTEYLEQLMNKFSATPFVVNITTSGKFSGFSNYKSLKDNIMLGLDSVPATKKDQIQKQIEAFIKESTLQSMIEPLFAYMPDKVVTKGEKWETTYPISGGGMNGMIFNTLTLGDNDNKTTKIDFTTELESMPSSDPNAYPKFDIKGNSTGLMTIDAKTGLTLNSTEKKKYSGNITIKNQGNEMKMPMTIESQTEIVQL